MVALSRHFIRQPFLCNYLLSAVCGVLNRSVVGLTKRRVGAVEKSFCLLLEYVLCNGFDRGFSGEKRRFVNLSDDPLTAAASLKRVVASSWQLRFLPRPPKVIHFDH